MKQAYCILHKSQLFIQRPLQNKTYKSFLPRLSNLKNICPQNMMNTKKLIKMAKKWQQRAALHRKRITFHRSSTATSSSATIQKGCFVVYTADGIRYVFPLKCLSNSVFQELLKISEEEFGLPAGGPITLPFDSVFLEYLIKLVEQRMDGDTEKALLMSISSARCSSLHCSLELQEQQSSITQQLLVF